MSRRRSTSMNAETLYLIGDRRQKAELFEEIPDRVGTSPITTRLSRATVVECIVHLSRSGVARSTAGPMNERQLRTWLGDLCDIEYDPTDDRGLDYRVKELKRIDQALEQAEEGDRR